MILKSYDLMIMCFDDLFVGLIIKFDDRVTEDHGPI